MQIKPGMVFNRLEVIEEIKKENKKGTYWKCRCKCGNIVEAYSGTLNSKQQVSCGCLRNEKNYELMKDMIFGEWTVIGVSYKSDPDRVGYVKCRCSCGFETDVNIRSLRRGKSISCGHDILEKMIISRTKYEDIQAGETFSMLTALDPTNYILDNGKNKKYPFQCECGNIIYITKSNFRKGHIQSCGCLKSKGEREIAKILKKNYVSFKQEVSFPDLKDKSLLRFDFGIYDLNENLIGLIEYNGRQHYQITPNWHSSPEAFKQACNRDRMKIEYCVHKKIPLLIIPFTIKDIENFLTTSFLWKLVTKNFND